ncbi:MAG TPA: ABC transporter permease [Firmicutes bacterium]|nr:ABC transporter permease [Bacillota bacterium]
MISWVLASAIQASVPLILAAEAGLVSERSGVVNLALEGMMLSGAFASMIGASVCGNVWLGLLWGVAVGAVLGLVHAYASVTWAADQIISATGINVVAAGGTSFLLKVIFRHAGTSPAVPTIPKLFPAGIAQLPGVGPILMNMTVIDVFALALPFALLYFYQQTPMGLRVRSVGERPDAAESVGIPVHRVRYVSVVASGALAGLAGAYLVLDVLGFFQQDMSAGRGYLGLVAMIFGKWNPVGTFLAALFFGLADAVQIALQLNLAAAIPKEAFLALPYVLALLALAGFVGRAEAPEADGKPFVSQK